jgi:hypothetical protein
MTVVTNSHEASRQHRDCFELEDTGLAVSAGGYTLEVLATLLQPGTETTSTPRSRARAAIGSSFSSPTPATFAALTSRSTSPTYLKHRILRPARSTVHAIVALATRWAGAGT